MSSTDIAIIIVLFYPIAFIIIYWLSCIAHRELKAEKKYREAFEIIKQFHEVGEEVVAWNVSYIPLIELLKKTKDYIK
jgi:hypothetical protein